MNIDWDKPVQTRDGREVRIYSTEGRHPTHTIIGEYFHAGEWNLARWTIGGTVQLDRPCERSLVNVPQQHTVFINVHRSDEALFRFNVYNDKAEADGIEGEGLE